MWTAPITTRRGGGTLTVRNTLPPSAVSTMPDLPDRNRRFSSSASGSEEKSSSWRTRRALPLPRLVMTIAARRAARAALSSESSARSMVSAPVGREPDAEADQQRATDPAHQTLRARGSRQPALHGRGEGDGNEIGRREGD